MSKTLQKFSLHYKVSGLNEIQLNKTGNSRLRRVYEIIIAVEKQ
jgi:hypothetical protein